MKFSVLRRGVTLVLLMGACLSGFSVFAQEKLFLKSGETFEGAVLEDTPAGVKMQVRTGTIKETKFFARDQVDRIERPKPDDVAFKALQAKLPTPSLLDEAGYRKLVDAADEFLTKFPDSPHRAEAQKIADELKAEAQKVATGGLKVNGEWISGEERKAHQENIDAEIMLARITQMARSGAYLPALRGLDALRTQYGKTRAYANSIALASDVMKAYGRSLTQAVQDRKNYEVVLEERKSRLTAAELAAVENDAAQKRNQIAALNTREKTAGLRWKTVNLDDTASIEQEIQVVRRELTSLEKVKVADLKLDSAALYEAESLLAQKQWVAAESKLREAIRSKSKLLVSKDPHVSRVLADLASFREEEAKAAKLAEIERAKQDAATKPIVTVADAKAGEGTAEDALDALMTERPAGTKSATQDKEAAKTGPKSKSTAKTKKISEESEATEDAPASAKSKKSPPATTASAGGGGLSFPVIMGGVFVLLLAVTGVIYYVDQQKKKAAGGGGGEEE